MDPILAYYRKIEATVNSGSATELSYRSALEELLREFDPAISVINEPKQQEFGAPDIVIQREGMPLGYIECKDLHVNLAEAAQSEQLGRYRKACDNLILTNYLEFRWFRGSEWQESLSFATFREGRLHNRYHRNAKLRFFLERFLRSSPQDIRSPDELGQVMATLTREIAHQIHAILDEPQRKTFLWKHKHDLEQELLPALSNAAFADMYAQTIAYALFAARMELEQLPAAEFTTGTVFTHMPSTNPFLHREFGHILQYLERDVKWAVDQLTTRLGHTQISEVMRDFRSGTAQRDAVVHFYEDFLATHDPALREQRGVYFTPEPVVGYIVRSVDALLRSHFGRRDGLADRYVHILDPAAGTGSFLLRVLEQIYETMASQRGTWPDYVRRQVLPRLYGFELLMAPYTLAHMRLALYLKKTNFQLGEDDRLGIYLTNTLDPGRKVQQEMWDDYIATEAQAAAAVKNEKPIMVVLGNPPYSGHSANKGAWIRELLRDYFQVDGAPLGERNPKMLQDDYVKFIRFGQHQIERNGEGILAFITNHGWLDNPTFRGMRQSLQNSFSAIYVLDIHGNIRKREVTPEGNRDQNVFDIQQGVSIAIFVKQRVQNGPARVFHADLWGLRKEKYSWLNQCDVMETDWQEIQPQSPSYYFTPFDYEGWRQYEHYWKITDIFTNYSMGITTGRDKLVIDFDEKTLRNRIEDFRNPNMSDEEIRSKYEIKDTGDWNLKDSRAEVSMDDNWDDYFQECLYRPFDLRHLYYHPALISRSRLAVMQHMWYEAAEPPFKHGVDARRRSRPDADLVSSPSDKSPRGGSTTVSSANTPSTIDSLSAAGEQPTSSHYGSTDELRDGDKSPTICEGGLEIGGGRGLPDGVLLHLEQHEGRELPVSALSSSMSHTGGGGIWP
ncbi:MAG: N-6 DNA methylase [Chloroflexi bacterium]|nr:N-6 DNA methylase [Chloroflexota bacterium]